MKCIYPSYEIIHKSYSLIIVNFIVSRDLYYKEFNGIKTHEVNPGYMYDGKTDIEFVIPHWFGKVSREKLINGTIPLTNKHAEIWGKSNALKEFDGKEYHWYKQMLQSEEIYNYLVTKGPGPSQPLSLQDAQDILPNALKIQFDIAGDHNDLQRFIINKDTEFTHSQMKYLLLMLKEELQEYFPELYHDKPRQILK